MTGNDYPKGRRRYPRNYRLCIESVRQNDRRQVRFTDPAGEIDLAPELAKPVGGLGLRDKYRAGDRAFLTLRADASVDKNGPAELRDIPIL